jgi:hypothetical protein
MTDQELLAQNEIDYDRQDNRQQYARCQREHSDEVILPYDEITGQSEKREFRKE